jgi:uncharacterized protein
MQPQEGGLAAVALAPSRVETVVNGVNVRAVMDTEYPFRETIKLTVTADAPARFPLHVRIPGWATNASVTVGGEVLHPAAGAFCRIEREWRGSTELAITLPMRARAVHRPFESLAVVRGPLIFSAPIAEERREIHQDRPYRAASHGDWELYPASPWNYGLLLEDNDIANLKFEEHAVGACPFSPEGAPVSTVVRLRKIAGWQNVNGSCGPLPAGYKAMAANHEPVRLIPYGCTNLRMTEFPAL